MTEFRDDEDEDANSVVAPSDISFFTDCEDDMTTAVSTDSEVHEETVIPGQACSDDVPLTSTHKMPESNLNQVELCSTNSEDNILLQNNSTQATVNSVVSPVNSVVSPVNSIVSPLMLDSCI